MKLYEIVDQSEWENKPVPQWGTPGHDPAKHRSDRERKGKALKHQDDILIRRMIQIEDKFPHELLSRGVPAQNDHNFPEMDIPAAVKANPDAYTEIEVPGTWFWEDMRDNDDYPDAYEVYYILQSSPRHDEMVKILNRHNQLKKLRSNLFRWPQK